MGGGPELIRAINKQRVLRLIRKAGSLSRADVAEQTGLTRPTISAVVTDLLAEGWLVEIGIGESSGGRPPIMLDFNPKARWVIGAELGAGHVRAVLADLSGRVINREKHRVISPDPMVELQSLERSIRSLISQLPRDEHSVPVAGIGVGITGIVDPLAGIWRYSPHFQVNGLNVSRWLEDRLNLPVWVENDARAMAWGERSFGIAQGIDNLVFVRVGVGIGAGMIIQGHRYGGAHNGAGELGHTIVSQDGPLCRCGKAGCLEALASATAIASQVVRQLKAGRPSLVSALVAEKLEQVIGTTVIEAGCAGDALARETLGEAGRYLGVAVGNLINLLNPAMVVIGGGTSRAGEMLMQPLRAAALASSLPALGPHVPVRLTDLGEDACPLGGAALVTEAIFESPLFE